jgi:hypothetical protein
MKHPTFETLLDFLDNRLPKAQADQVTAHLALPCAACQGEIDGMRDVLQLLGHERLSEPSPAAVRRAIRLFGRFYERPGADERPRLIARLLFDDLLAPRAAAVRGIGNERQLLYGAEGFDIDLQIADEGNQESLRLLGQVMPPADDWSQVQGGLVRLAREDDAVTSATADELGTFAFNGLAPGDYELWLDLPRAKIWVPHVTLGPLRTG